LHGAIKEFEIWCNNGRNWLVQDQSDDSWVVAETIIHPTSSTSTEDFSSIKKYDTGATNEWEKIFTTSVQRVKCLEVRVVFTKFVGNVLGTKLGIGIVDPTGAICDRELVNGVSPSTSATNTGASGK